MAESFVGTPRSEKPLEDRLDSWKEIAAYLNRDVTTVQRWEKREAMPVHRHLHDRMGSVYASRAELDAWVRGRNLRVAQENENETPPAPAPEPPLPVEPPPHSSTFSTRRRLVVFLAAAAATLAIGVGLWLQRTEYFWRNPIADARFQTVTDFGGVEQAAALSRDGHFVAFLSDRDGQMDVWVTQAGSGQFHNLTRGSVAELPNSSIRTLGFSPDGSLVTFWLRKRDGSNGGDISVWAVPTLGGQPRPYLEGVAEFDCRSPLSLPLVVIRRGVRLLRSRHPSRQIRHLAHPCSGWNPGTDHVAGCKRELSGSVWPAHIDVSCERPRWLGAVAL
jgi:hypothetical protein